MKKTIYLLSILFLLACAGCGSDEPSEGKPISCLAHYTDSYGNDNGVLANFYLFEGTNFVSIDPDSHSGIMDATKIEAVTASGQHVQNIGWCHTYDTNRTSIVPVYTDGNSYNRIHEGNFTIVCITSQGLGQVYMMKTFSKKLNELVAIDAHFTKDDFQLSWGEFRKIPWR